MCSLWWFLVVSSRISALVRLIFWNIRVLQTDSSNLFVPDGIDVRAAVILVFLGLPAASTSRLGENYSGFAEKIRPLVYMVSAVS